MKGVGKVNVKVGFADPAAPVIVKLPRRESLLAATLATLDVPQPEVSPMFPVTSGVPLADDVPNQFPLRLFEPPVMVIFCAWSMIVQPDAL